MRISIFCNSITNQINNSKNGIEKSQKNNMAIQDLQKIVTSWRVLTIHE